MSDAVQDPGEDAADQQRHEGSGREACQHGPQAVEQKQPHDVAAGCADGNAQADLARSLTGDERRHAVDANDRKAQRQDGQRAGQ